MVPTFIKNDFIKEKTNNKCSSKFKEHFLEIFLPEQLSVPKTVGPGYLGQNFE